MIYTNDEADKEQRKKDFLLRVWVLPLITGLIILGLLYLLGQRHVFQQADIKSGYWMTPIVVFALFGYNRSKWLKMPDGTYHHTSVLSVGSKKFANEPVTYEEEFYNSSSKKMIPVAIGLAIIGFGVYLMFARKMYLYSLFGIVFGLASVYRGITGLLDKSAQLKIGTEGLWTKKLGFVSWTEIQETKVIEDRKGENELIHLEIWLKDTPFAQAGKPDEFLNLGDIKNGQYVEMVISNFSRTAEEKNR